jgi:UDP-N-acetylmuramoyl-tripeptide--D-alanyl-D-alanine ligase
MNSALYIIAAAVLAFSAYVSGREQLHMAQLEGYRPKQYWWWMRHNLKHIFLKELILFLPAAVIFIISNTAGYSNILLHILFLHGVLQVYI